MLVSALLISSIVATPIGSATDSQLVGIDRQRRDGDTKCPNDRPFVCYVYEALGQDYPAWLKKVGDGSDEDDMKCAACSVEKLKECLTTASFTANNAAEALYFPFNLCTREMLASGLCEGKSLHIEAYMPKSIPHTTQYFLQCDAGFVIPHDPKGTPPYYALRRALSGPYASLKSEEETIDLWQSLKVPETPAEQTSVDKEKAEAQHEDRVKRQSSALPAVSYPRCIKIDGLPADQKAIVQADELLDCDKNPFYKELGHESLTVTKLPLCTEVDPNQKFCRTSADSQSTKPTATTPVAEGFLDRLTVPEPWALVSFVLACSVNALTIIATAVAWYIRFGRPEKDDDDDDDDEEMDSHSRKHDSSKKKTGDGDDA
ncbi:unnamed protein product, partial [Mesorhabditis spiculigera]